MTSFEGNGKKGAGWLHVIREVREFKGLFLAFVLTALVVALSFRDHRKWVAEHKAAGAVELTHYVRN